jgi:hypothetical protein
MDSARAGARLNRCFDAERGGDQRSSLPWPVGKVDADAVEGVLHLQQGLVAAWDMPVKVVALLALCVHTQVPATADGQERHLMPWVSSNADNWHIEGKVQRFRTLRVPPPTYVM